MTRALPLLFAFVAAVCVPLEAPAATTPKRAAKAPAKPAARKPPPLPEATPEQLEAAQRVFYGHYDCEFKQALDIAADSRNPGYVEVRQAKSLYVMKPVLSSTGALRLEDVKGQTLMVQIDTKSMLLNVKQGRRLVDDCITARQRELTAQASAAKAAEAAASAVSAAASAASSAASAAETAASAVTEAAAAASAAASAASSNGR